MKLRFIIPLALLALGAGVYAYSYGLHGDDTDPAAFRPAEATGRGAPVWVTDLAEAKRLARSENKRLLLYFTGSDWCPWCLRLDREVLATPAFHEFARRHFVLVKVDFPERRAQAPEERRQNEQLATAFGIEGFPTLLVLDVEGKKLGTVGYQAGGPGPSVASLSKILGLK